MTKVKVIEIRKYVIIISLLFAILMMTAVSASDNTTENGNIPIEYQELQTDDYDPFYLVIGADVEEHMQVYGESEIAKEQYIYRPITSNENDTRQTTYFTNTVVNRTSNGNATIIISGNENITGQIYFSFLKTPLNLTDGKVKYDFNGLERGHYSFKYYYTGNEEYKDGIGEMEFVIPSIITQLTLENDNIEMYYKDGTFLKAFLKDQRGKALENKDIRFEINGVRYWRNTDENGSASIRINLNPGSYNITTFYRGSLSTAGNLTCANITILPTITGNDITKLYRNKTQYNVNVTDNKGNALVNQSVKFNINGVFYNRTSNENGTATLNINLPHGTYIITAENMNDGSKTSNIIEVLPTIISEDLIKIYKNDSQFYVKALKTDGSPLANTNLTFNINGVFYNRTTDVNGKTKLNINLIPGTYIITTENPYDNCKVSNTIIVTPYLFTEDLTKYYKNASRFNAKLVDSNYNPQANREITFTVNGNEYKRTTNNNGEASLAINLTPGEYEITTKNSEYEVKNKITVLPTLIDLHENNITIDLDKKEKYEVCVLDGRGNPYPNQTVTFRYIFSHVTKNVDVKTDENGIAGFAGTHVNQYNPIEIEYNGYSISNNNVLFRKYPEMVIRDLPEYWQIEKIRKELYWIRKFV